MFKPLLPATLLASALSWPAQAAGDADLAAELASLRAEFDAKLKALQASYETRIKQLEARQAPPPAAEARGNDFNPAIGLVLQGRYAQSKPGERAITGFLPGEHAHGASRGFNLDHTELTLEIGRASCRERV